MSREKVEIARRGIDAFNRGDVEALAGDTTEDVELFAALAGAVENGGFHGRAGIEAYFQITAETWSEFRILGEDFSNLGDRVLVAGRIWGRGKGLDSALRLRDQWLGVWDEQSIAIEEI
jgi:ketosteroid isomerase-like protein